MNFYVNISGINWESTVDGDGIRVTIYFSGCNHNCAGCHNPQTWDFKNGEPFTYTIEKSIFDYIKNHDNISGITLSGGDPMYSAAAIIPFIERFKEIYPNKNIWVYTGFTYEEIQSGSAYELLKLCDILVDGKFDIEKKIPDLMYRGSSNQRIIDIQESIKNNTIKEFKK
jgi:anaerobic ribonucleoside-triphosphate reductase activating protein